jgi:hypothetical protein
VTSIKLLCGCMQVVMLAWTSSHALTGCTHPSQQQDNFLPATNKYVVMIMLLLADLAVQMACMHACTQASRQAHTCRVRLVSVWPA